MSKYEQNVSNFLLKNNLIFYSKISLAGLNVTFTKKDKIYRNLQSRSNAFAYLKISKTQYEQNVSF